MPYSVFQYLEFFSLKFDFDVVDNFFCFGKKNKIIMLLNNSLHFPWDLKKIPLIPKRPSQNQLLSSHVGVPPQNPQVRIKK